MTRRVTQQQFLLRPSGEINAIILYCIAFAAQKTGVLVHAICALSNHLHIVATDPEARLPEFSYTAFKLIAKCVNAHRGRWENMWAGGVQPSYVRLEDHEAIVEKIAYTIANPVESALVTRSKDWPGVAMWQPGRYKVRRPTVFFAEDGATDEVLFLDLTPPPLSPGLRRREVLEIVGRAIADREAELRAQHRAAGRRFLGKHAIATQAPTDSPRSKEPRRGLSPRVATRDRWRRIEALQRMKSFADDYRQAFALWRSGFRDVVFPPGVYKLRLEHAVKFAEP